MEKKQEIDTNLYSRQIGTFGMETMGKLIQMKVFIHGLRGLGVETAKNIILAGPHTVNLSDPVTTQIQDLGSNFYLTTDHVGNVNRDQASLAKLSELNPYVNVAIDNIDLSGDLENLKNYNVVVFTELLPNNLVSKINAFCRENNVAFIYTAVLGPAGFAFVDFGEKFYINDHDGEQCKQYILADVSQEEKGVVLIHGDNFLLSTGDHVVFKEVEGMTELNDAKPMEITYVSNRAFRIGDTTGFGKYTSGGIIQQVKVPKEKNYKGFAESLNSPYNPNPTDPVDLKKFGRNEMIHLSVRALGDFIEAENRLPELNNADDAAAVLKIAQKIKEESAEEAWVQNLTNFGAYNEDVVLNISKWARSSIVPSTAYMGGVIAQEIVKYTGKYSPINQWFYYDKYETVEVVGEVDRTLLQSRYDDFVAVYGVETLNKLRSSNIFMVGAGALGCEFLKNFSLLGACNDGGKFFVTDNDNIEVSNLNRQFLFRKDDVGKSKSKSASREAVKMNTGFTVTSSQSFVAPSTEDVFTDKFWASQDIIINAVDNIKARNYIDSRAVWFQKPLIDSGTLGTKGHVQVIIPHVTSCYRDTKDPEEDTVPFCTLRNFPNVIEHCIEWARDKFDGNFVKTIQDAKSYLQNKEKFFSELEKEGNSSLQLLRLTEVKAVLDIRKSNDFTRCIDFAVKKYTNYFDHNIRTLLYNFPADYKNKDGSKFWSGTKRTPTAYTYNSEDALDISFIIAYSALLARAIGIEENLDFGYVVENSGKITVPEFVAKKVKIQTDENENNENDDEPMDLDEDENNLASLIKELKLTDEKINSESVLPHEFEKDDDSNYHIDFIHAAANLRARNYKIDVCDRQKTKMIAGKIVPAIATTTASVTGLVCFEVITVLFSNDITKFSNAFINLAIPIHLFTEPDDKIKIVSKDFDKMLLGPIVAIPEGHSIWDKVVIKQSMTCGELGKYIEENYNNSEMSSIMVKDDSVIVYQGFMPSGKKRIDLKIEDVYFGVKGIKKEDYPKNYLVLELSLDAPSGEYVLIPAIEYVFRE